MPLDIKAITSEDYALMLSMLDCFAEVFEDRETYTLNTPDRKYFLQLMETETFIPLVALRQGTVVGALAAYELKKFEQQRSEIYIYDLGVREKYRNQGIATSLIHHLKKVARERNAWVIFVQADYVDKPAVGLYTKLGIREDVLHFDIPINDEQ